MGVIDEVRERYQKWADLHGLKRSKASSCIARLHGKRTCSTDMDGRGICECNRDFGFDHTSLWLKDSNPHVVVTCPYSILDEQMRNLSKYADKNGLKVIINQESLYSPGNSMNVEIYSSE